MFVFPFSLVVSIPFTQLELPDARQSKHLCIRLAESCSQDEGALLKPIWGRTLRVVEFFAADIDFISDSGVNPRQNSQDAEKSSSQSSWPAWDSSINSTQTIDIDEAYVLGVGDGISLSFFNVPEYNGQYQIMVDGTINLPLVGNIKIAGMNLKQASEAISVSYETELEYPIITVNLVQPRAFRIAVAGEISQPGLYTLPAAEGGQFLTVAQTIQAAGGATQAADLKRVEVRRREGTSVTRTITVNLLELLKNGDLEPNITLRDGDTIFIPAATEISLVEANQLAISNLRVNSNQPFNVVVVGEVAQPGPYRLAGNNSQPTLIQALQLAGGINPAADLRQIKVRRQTRQGNAQEIKIDLWQILQTGDLSQDLVLQSGDTITIPTAEDLTLEQIASLAASSLSPEVIKVNLIGEVGSPGQLELRANTTLNQAILAAGGLNKGRGSKKVQLIRFNPNGTVTEQEIQSDFAQEMNPQKNPILQNNDVIVVGRTSRAQLRDNLFHTLNLFRWLSPFYFFAR